MKNVLLISCLLLTSIGYGQIGIGSRTLQKENNLKIGGGMGMNFGDRGYFSFNISPFVGYEIAPTLEAGVTAGYQYTKQRPTKQHLFSAGPYINYYPFQGIFLRAHFEHFNGKSTIDLKKLDIFNPNDPLFIENSKISRNFSENALWVGGGFRTPGRVQFFAGVVYNLLHDNYKSTFAEAYQPIVGVSVGL